MCWYFERSQHSSGTVEVVKEKGCCPLNVVQIQVSISCRGMLRASLLSWHPISMQDIVKKLSSKILSPRKAKYVLCSIEKECEGSRSVSAEAVHCSASLPA